MHLSSFLGPCLQSVCVGGRGERGADLDAGSSYAISAQGTFLWRELCDMLVVRNGVLFAPPYLF